MESLVAGTGTCNSPLLAEYYEYWEKRIYNAITVMIVRGMASLKSLFQVQKNAYNDKVLPFCEVKATMAGKDIVLNPSFSELSKYFSRMIKHLGECAKAFVRWNNGICIISEPIDM